MIDSSWYPILHLVYKCINLILILTKYLTGIQVNNKQQRWLLKNTKYNFNHYDKSNIPINYLIKTLLAYVTCPGSYACESSDTSRSNNGPTMCISMSKVCNGKQDCPLGDDEVLCGKWQAYRILWRYQRIYKIPSALYQYR